MSFACEAKIIDLYIQIVKSWSTPTRTHPRPKHLPANRIQRRRRPRKVIHRMVMHLLLPRREKGRGRDTLRAHRKDHLPAAGQRPVVIRIHRVTGKRRAIRPPLLVEITRDPRRRRIDIELNDRQHLVQRVITPRKRPDPGRMYPQLPAALSIGLKAKDPIGIVQTIRRYLPEVVRRRRLAPVAGT